MVFVAPPSRRLSGGRLTRRLRGRDALTTAGKMPALHICHLAFSASTT